MTWAEFLTHILRAHAQALQRLAAFLGEAELLELLETAGESSVELRSKFEIKKEWLSATPATDSTPPYLELEGAVQEMHLSSFLEFHVWAYPFYRQIIESSLELKAKIPKAHATEVLELLTEEAIQQAQTWIEQLPVREDLAQQVKSIAQLPWIRFRTTILGKMGRRPVVALG
jgi:hypothetical protein